MLHRVTTCHNETAKFDQGTCLPIVESLYIGTVHASHADRLYVVSEILLASHSVNDLVVALENQGTKRAPEPRSNYGR